MDVCLRCDWEGDAPAGSCPRCGAPLYRSRARAGPALDRERPAADAPRSAADAATSAHPAEGARRPPAPRASSGPTRPWARSAGGPGPGRPWGLLGGSAATLVVLALLWMRAPMPGPAPAGGPEPLRLHGTLVYATDVDRRQQRLWLLDLATRRLERGPRIPRATDLVASSGGWGTWVAFLSRRPEGGVRAFVVRDLSPGARPERVATGDLAAWGPHATSVVVVRRGPLLDECRRRVVIRFLTVEPRSHATVYRRPVLCGDVVSVGRDAASTYFTQVTRGRVGVFIPGFERRPHPVLRRHAMLSVAFTGGMLVTPIDRGWQGHGIGPFGARAERDPPPRPPAGPAAAWTGRGRPEPFVSGADTLLVGRVLAWSRSASRALVVGTLHDRLGLFVVDTSPDLPDRTPRFVSPLRGAVGATFASDGTALVAMGGELYALREGGLRDVPLPDGAPVPTGPVVWLP